MTVRVPDRLPCGRDLADLIAVVADGWVAPPGDHDTCPHCLGALASLERLWSRLDAMASREIPAPPSLQTAVVRRVRRERFASAAAQAVYGVLSRLSRAILCYGYLGGMDPRPQPG